MISIKIQSRNRKSLNKFYSFFKKIRRTKLYIKKLNIKFINNKKKNAFFTILKSPHINKTAQEQFSYSTFAHLLEIEILKIQKLLIILKKITNKLFPDVYVKTIFNIEENKKNKKLLVSQLLNTDYIKCKKKNLIYYLLLLSNF